MRNRIGIKNNIARLQYCFTHSTTLRSYTSIIYYNMHIYCVQKWFKLWKVDARDKLIEVQCTLPICASRALQQSSKVFKKALCG